MKPWQVVILFYVVAAIVGVEFGAHGLPMKADIIAALIITLLALAWIRLLKKNQNLNR